MRVINIGTDRKVFDKNSAVSQRMAEYRKLFGELHVVLVERQISGIWSAYKEAVDLIQDSKSQIQDFIISTQDPFETGLVGVLLKLRFNLPLQIQLHTDFRNKYFLLSSPLNFIRFFLGHILLPFADSVRVVSERVGRSVAEFGKHVSILPIYTEARSMKHEARRKTGKIQILTVGRLEKEKDIGTAIKAFKIVNDKYPNAEFVIAGDGSQRENLERIAGKSVKFLGWQEDIGNLYTQADIYVSTSLFEGYGMATVEAALSGLPLVLSDAGVAGDFFGNKEAYICKPKDVACFAQSLEKLTIDQNLRLQMGEGARTSALERSCTKEEYLAAYKNYVEDAARHFKKRNLLVTVINSSRILRFILAGVTAALVQITALYIFTGILGIYYLTSSALSFLIALFVSFTLQKFWAFRDRKITGVHYQFLKYIMIVGIGLILNTVLMYFFVEILKLWYILAQIITGGLIAIFNFFSYRRFIFIQNDLPKKSIK